MNRSCGRVVGAPDFGSRACGSNPARYGIQLIIVCGFIALHRPFNVTAPSSRYDLSIVERDKKI